jgi:NAD(P)-dependent dehydrogenase (short-subunit alcohol dehydrogenase family)
MADPSEIAKLAVYLASDDSAYVVGADFLIDGDVYMIVISKGLYRNHLIPA